MFENMDWGNLEIEYNEFENFDSSKPLEDQIDFLKEDLFKGKLKNYLIYVGYSPEFTDDGEFQILMIKDNDWDYPYMKRKTNNLKHLERIMREFVDFVVA